LTFIIGMIYESFKKDRNSKRNVVMELYQNIFGTFVNQTKRLLALIFRRFEAIRHKFHYKCPFKKPLAKGRRKPCEQPTKGK